MDAIWLSTAFLFGVCAIRIRLPLLAGYLIAGYVLGQFQYEGPESLAHISEAGLMLLMFSIGLKLDIPTLFQRPVLVSSGMLVAILAPIIGIVVVLINSVAITGVGLAIALTFSSTVFAAKMLESRREITSLDGRIVIGILIVQDLIAIAILATSSAQSITLWALGLLAMIACRPILHALLDRAGHDELQLAMCVALALGGGAIGHAAGLSGELGALIAGALLAGHAFASEIGRIIWSLKEIFLIGFFVQIGLQVQPTQTAILVAIGLISLLPLKGAIAFYGMVRSGLRARTAFVAAAGLATYSEFALICGAALAATGRVSRDLQTAIALTVGLSLIAAGPLNRRVHRIFGRFEDLLKRFEFDPQVDIEPKSTGDAEWVIVGLGRTGGAAYRQLEASGYRVLGLESDPVKVNRHLDKGRNVVYADAEDHELWDDLDMSGLRGVILTLPDLDSKLIAIEGLKRNAFGGQIVVTSLHHEEDDVLRSTGATLICRPFADAGERLAERVIEQELKSTA